MVDALLRQDGAAGLRARLAEQPEFMGDAVLKELCRRAASTEDSDLLGKSLKLIRALQEHRDASVSAAQNLPHDRAKYDEDSRLITSAIPILVDRLARELTWGRDVIWGCFLGVCGVALHYYSTPSEPEKRNFAKNLLEQGLAFAGNEADGRSWACLLEALAESLLQSGVDRTGAVEYAVELLEGALQGVSRTDDPVSWRRIKGKLGVAYVERLSGNHAQNIETAIEIYLEVLDACDRAEAPEFYASVVQDLGVAYDRRIRGDRAENTEKAIACYNDALGFYTKERAPHAFARIQTNLSIAYRARLVGDPAENLDNSIRAAEAALEVISCEDDPAGWATIQMNLGSSLAARHRGDPAENFQRAMSAYDAALTVFSYETYPHAWANVRSNMGSAYLQHSGIPPQGERTRRAIECFQDALRVHTREQSPASFAVTVYQLAEAYRAHREGDETENLTLALAACDDALSVADLAFAAHDALRIGMLRVQLILRLGAGSGMERMTALDELQETLVERLNELDSPAARRAALGAVSELGELSALVAAELGDPAGGLERLERMRTVLLRETLDLRDAHLRCLPESAQSDIRKARDRLVRLQAEAQSFTPGKSREFGQIAGDIRKGRMELRRLVHENGVEAPPEFSAAFLRLQISADMVLVVPVATTLGGGVFISPASPDDDDDEMFLPLPHLTRDALAARVFRWHVCYLAILESIQTGQQTSAILSAASVELELLLSWLWNELFEHVCAKVSLQSDFNDPDRCSRTRLAIMPTGHFSGLPLHAAWRDADGQMRTVQEDFLVHYITSLTAFGLHNARPPVAQPEPLRPFGLFNPTGDLAASEHLEAMALRALFPDIKAEAIQIGPAATRGALLTGTPDCTHLHLSCHGRFNWLLPEKSGLMLADGNFAIPDVAATLRLDHCRWVMLSACETGTTDMRAPDEATSLAGAFLAAGAEAVTGAFWAIPDLSTALFVFRAYEEHLRFGREPADAVRTAAQWLREFQGAVRSDGSDMTGAVTVPTTQFRYAGPDAAPIGDDGEEPPPAPYASPLFWAAFATWGL
ncbi:MAG: CHAT domain-containing protein [Bradyrhizobium sp.]|nr:CHAT domain-containing protein [Bradyrhizobium sp.]